MVPGEYSYTNPAGHASAVRSEPIMLDSTPPTHPHIVGCTLGVRERPNGAEAYYYYQNSSDAPLVTMHMT